MSAPVLVGDVGGTNARFAISHHPGEISTVKNFKVADFSTCEAAIAAYLTSLPPETLEGNAIARAAIAAAGPLDDKGAIALTNAKWQLHPARLSETIASAPVRLFNDLEAVALAVPHLASDDYRTLGTPIEGPFAGNVLALNLGTGLGAAIAVHAGARWSAIATEAGHMTFAARTPQERDLTSHATSYEDLLSGGGLRRLSTLVAETPAKPQGFQPSEAAPGTDASASEEFSPETWAVFTEILARLAGDLVLATGTWGGVYLTGSVAAAWSRAADIGAFREIFEHKGKMQARMSRVPTRLITAPEPALQGLSYTEH